MCFVKHTIRALLPGVAAATLLLTGTPAHATEPGQWNRQVQKLNDVEGGLDDTLEALGIEPATT